MIAPRPPDPTEEYAQFISWLLKHRTMISLSDKRLMKKFPHLDLENLVKTVGEYGGFSFDLITGPYSKIYPAYGFILGTSMVRVL